MKVMHIQLLPKMSGVQQVSYDLLSGFPDDWEKYIVFSAPIPKAIKDKFNSIDVEVIEIVGFKREISLISDLKVFIKILNLIKKYKPTIVHTHSTKPGILGRIAARIAGVKQIVHTVHGIAFHRKERRFKRSFYLLVEWIASNFGHVIVSVNKYYGRYYRYFPGKFKIIHNGVSQVENLLFEKQMFTIGFIGRFDEQKNPLFVIELAKIFREEQVKFVMAGDGELMSVCRDRISSYGLDNVELLGWVEDKSEFYSRLSLLLQPSRWEAFGLTVAEASSAGVPALVSDVEGLPEVVFEKQEQIFIEGDLKDCEMKLRELTSNKVLLAECSSSVQKNYSRSFTLERMQCEYIDLYLDLGKKL